MHLRDYQVRAIQEIEAHYQHGTNKVLLWLQGGAGKTVIFAEMLKRVRDRGQRGIILVHRRELVLQASRKLTEIGVDHEIIMGSIRFTQDAKIYVASVDTFSRRLVKGACPQDFDLIVIDEAHYAGSDKYISVSEAYPRARYLAVTATPYPRSSIRHVADVVVSPICAQGLVDAQYLVKCRYFGSRKAREEITRAKIPKLAGDFKIDALATVMRKKALYGDIVTALNDKAPDRRGILFAVNVAHSIELAAHLSAHGIPARHLDAQASDAERKAAIDALNCGKLRIITNCEIFSTGVDIPCADVIVMARPTESLSLFIQMATRGTRLYPKKQDFILLDHAGNVWRHGFITDHHDPQLDGHQKKSGQGAKIATFAKDCPICGATVHLEALCCTECGAPFITKKSENKIRTIGEELVEIAPRPAGRFASPEEHAHMMKKLAELRTIAIQKGYKLGWVYHQFKARFSREFGRDIADQFKKQIFQTPSPVEIHNASSQLNESVLRVEQQLWDFRIAKRSAG